MILIIDNYDSFVMNIIHFMELEENEYLMKRNDEITIEEVKKIDDLEAIIISPGPMTPKEAGVSNELIRYYYDKLPILGICLGLQLLFESSEETPGVEGLGILKGKIVKIPDNGELKIPHMGWNSLYFQNQGRLFKNLPQDSYVYFVHSYYLQAEDQSIVKATTEYSTHIHASVEKDNVFACQFHPEKSSDVGLAILKNFCEI